MDTKTEPYISGEYFDIPAAEQEVTVDSNEQPSVTGVGSTLVQNLTVSQNEGGFPHGGTPVIRLAASGQGPRPRVIMLQRASQGGVTTFPQPTPAPRQFRTATVLGPGGKQYKAVYVPKTLLQNRMAAVGAPGRQTIGPGGTVIAQGSPRIVTVRPAVQFRGQTPANFTILSTPGGAQIRPRTFIVSNASGQARIAQGFPIQQGQQGEEIDSSFLTPVVSGTEGFVQPGFLDLSGATAVQGAAHFARQTSPGGHESEGEQDQVATGLKTNGLRRYARCVCNKVKEKNITSYGEVADELVHEYAAEHPMIPSEQLAYIQKNIRRRVYDALNVLMALNVLQKEKKEIRWVGLPVNMIEECRRLEEEREKRQNSLRNKTAEIQELILQLIAFKNLIARNRINERFQQNRDDSEVVANTASGKKSSASLDESVSQLIPKRLDRVPLPFLVVSSNRKTVIDCNISNDKLEYYFNFDQPFEIRDEVDTLKRMGLTLRLGSPQCTQEEYNQCLELIPPSLRFYVEAIFERRQAIVPDFEALHQQRRLYVEARLAEVTQAGDTGPADPSDVAGPHAHHHQHHRRRFGDEFFDDDEEETTGNGGGEQIHLQHSTDITPGDTQHYARAAASRGFVVPGGPGGLLRHGAGNVHHQAVKMTVEGAMGETDTAVAAISGAAGDAGTASGGRLFDVGDDESDVDMAEEEMDDQEDLDDDVDMHESATKNSL